MKEISIETLRTVQTAEKELKRLARLSAVAKRPKTRKRHQDAMLQQAGIVLDSTAQALEELAITASPERNDSFNP